MLWAGERLCKRISNHSFCWDVLYNELSCLDELMSEMILDCDVFGMWMEDWDLRECESALVVAVNDERRL